MGLFDFLTYDIAIDLGTANTLIIHNDKVVVDAPSIVVCLQPSGWVNQGENAGEPRLPHWRGGEPRALPSRGSFKLF